MDDVHFLTTGHFRYERARCVSYHKLHSCQNFKDPIPLPYRIYRLCILDRMPISIRHHICIILYITWTLREINLKFTSGFLVSVKWETIVRGKVELHVPNLNSFLFFVFKFKFSSYVVLSIFKKLPFERIFILHRMFDFGPATRRQ